MKKQAVLYLQSFLISTAVFASGSLTLGKPATQSSTAGSAVAAHATDGNVDGRFQNQSVASTNEDLNPWWEVDLGSVSSIDFIRLWLRTDCCQTVEDAHIFVSDVAFASTDLVDTQNQSGVSEFFVSGPADPGYGVVVDIPIDRTGRYVRVQLEGTTRLSLAEVEVFESGATAGTLETYVVDSNLDLPDTSVGDGVCSASGSICTLRAAIEESNVDGAPSKVLFNIAGSGAHRITLGSQLPPLYDHFGGTEIDGFSQPGASPNALPIGNDAVVLVEVNGLLTFRGLKIKGANNQVKGLAIFEILSDGIGVLGRLADSNVVAGNYLGSDATGVPFSGAGGSGVHVEKAATKTRIGGPSPADRNSIVGFGRGIDNFNWGTDDTVIENNYIGLAPNGVTAFGNSIHGIDIQVNSRRTTVRGNVISGNARSGIEISHGVVNSGHVIEANLIGSDAAGLDVSLPYLNGQHGIHVEDGIFDVLVRDNVVVNSRQVGIRLFQNVHDISVEGNLVGVLPNGTPGPNGSGVEFSRGAFDNTLGPNNVVAYSDGHGVSVLPTDAGGGETSGNTISQNSIFSNTLDGVFVDTLPYFPPTVTNAFVDEVSGTSTCDSCVIELFLTDDDEGETFVGSGMTDVAGAFSVDVLLGTLEQGDLVTATVTDVLGNTSPFSLPAEVENTPLFLDGFESGDTSAWSSAVP